MVEWKQAPKKSFGNREIKEAIIEIKTEIGFVAESRKKKLN